MTEIDLISIFEQFPFTKLLVYLINIEEREGKKGRSITDINDLIKE